MADISKDACRTIISDFAHDIAKNKKKGAKPSTEVIPFRNDRQTNREREVWEVRSEFLRFRKDNGRIASDVISYEREHGALKEDSSTAQEILRNFLFEKDREKTLELESSIQHDAQREPAVITCDGFLVNGNRRKMALDMLYDKTKDSTYQWMKVVILPGDDDTEEGGPPTIKEIEQIENRYQLQSEGKAEYSSFDRALSMRRKIETNMSLEEQLRDDPTFTHLSAKEFKKKLRDYEEQYLKPLECVDRYLNWLNRPDLYSTVSARTADRAGRWQAFLDYYYYVWRHLEDENKRMKHAIEEHEVGDIEEIAFKIIRKREFPQIGKLHQIMRKLLAWYKNPEARKALLKLLDDVDDQLPEQDIYDNSGKELSEKEKDRKWAARYQEPLYRNVKKAKAIFEQDKEKETPLVILDAALKKLYHEQLTPEHVAVSDAKQAMDTSRQINQRSVELEKIFYQIMKGPEKLRRKYNKK